MKDVKIQTWAIAHRVDPAELVLPRVMQICLSMTSSPSDITAVPCDCSTYRSSRTITSCVDRSISSGPRGAALAANVHCRKMLTSSGVKLPVTLQHTVAVEERQVTRLPLHRVHQIWRYPRSLQPCGLSL